MKMRACDPIASTLHQSTLCSKIGKNLSRNPWRGLLGALIQNLIKYTKYEKVLDIGRMLL